MCGVQLAEPKYMNVIGTMSQTRYMIMFSAALFSGLAACGTASPDIALNALGRSCCALSHIEAEVSEYSFDVHYLLVVCCYLLVVFGYLLVTFCLPFAYLLLTFCLPFGYLLVAFGYSAERGAVDRGCSGLG